MYQSSVPKPLNRKIVVQYFIYNDEFRAAHSSLRDFDLIFLRRDYLKNGVDVLIKGHPNNLLDWVAHFTKENNKPILF